MTDAMVMKLQWKMKTERVKKAKMLPEDPVHQAADKITPKVDGEEPLSDETVETTLSNFGTNKSFVCPAASTHYSW